MDHYCHPSTTKVRTMGDAFWSENLEKCWNGIVHWWRVHYRRDPLEWLSINSFSSVVFTECTAGWRLPHSMEPIHSVHCEWDASFISFFSVRSVHQTLQLSKIMKLWYAYSNPIQNLNSPWFNSDFLSRTLYTGTLHFYRCDLLQRTKSIIYPSLMIAFKSLSNKNSHRANTRPNTLFRLVSVHWPGMQLVSQR